MADFRVDLTEQEALQIIGDHINKEYGFERKSINLQVAWKGPTPEGVRITNPGEIRDRPFED